MASYLGLLVHSQIGPGIDSLSWSDHFGRPDCATSASFARLSCLAGSGQVSSRLSLVRHLPQLPSWPMHRCRFWRLPHPGEPQLLQILFFLFERLCSISDGNQNAQTRNSNVATDKYTHPLPISSALLLRRPTLSLSR